MCLNQRAATRCRTASSSRSTKTLNEVKVDIRCRNMSQDAVAVRRLIYVTAVALAFNGSNGFFVVLQPSETEKIDFYCKLGLVTLKEAGLPEEILLMGHPL
ncbi:unnamed protein product [Toxocara canis]|uniref:N-acetyltransferase domain-containing protein n=1 Tax=Toxocara canis TaxID=6265 RepID=A0A183UQU6_TOXCA|nr:unnamed protein product [Toxocara canis]